MDQYRVFGNPIAQSRSPFIHTAFAKQTAQILNYQSQLVENDCFKEAVSALMLSGGKGANVTMPFKDDAFAICTEHTERAKQAGAVNTLSFVGDSIIGDNTDGVGLVNDLKQHNVTLKSKRILLLGAGGAAKGVVSPLLDESPKLLVIANRTVSKANAIRAQYPNSSIEVREFERANEFEFDVIINATSTGLTGGALPLSNNVFTKNVICYDMVYGKELSPFLLNAKELGVKKVIDGLGMLVEQAAESFYIWRNVRPNTEQVLLELRTALQNK